MRLKISRASLKDWPHRARCAIQITTSRMLMRCGISLGYCAAYLVRIAIELEQASHV